MDEEQTQKSNKSSAKKESPIRKQSTMKTFEEIHKGFNIAPLLNNLVKQVKKRMKLLPYEIKKCYQDPFQQQEDYVNVKFDPNLEMLNRRE